MSITVQYISMNLKNINLVCTYNLIRAIKGVGGLSCEIERLEDWAAKSKRLDAKSNWVKTVSKLGHGGLKLGNGKILNWRWLVGTLTSVCRRRFEDEKGLEKTFDLETVAIWRGKVSDKFWCFLSMSYSCSFLFCVFFLFY
jgi:hypothetical protein